MKGISLSLETLSNGQLRATVRNDGATVTYKEGTPAQGRELCLAALREGASAHQISPNRFDFTYIALNPAAQRVLDDSAQALADFQIQASGSLLI